MSNEIELKFEINTNDIASLKYYLDQWADCDEAEFSASSALSSTKRCVTKQNLTNTYYDTSDYYLRNHGCGLRVRGGDDGLVKRFEITLKRDKKSIAGLHERAEFNVDLPDSVPDLTVLPCHALPNDCDIAELQRNLLPLFTTDFERQAWLISFASSEIEVALDQGQISSNNQSIPIKEVELEIKQGNTHDLLNFAIELSRFNLHLFSQSKASRGYRLLNNLAPKKCAYALSSQCDLPKLLEFWQQNEEYALEVNDLEYYKQTLNQVNDQLTNKLLFNEPEFAQWQAALLVINSVKEFAFSEINTKLKLMLIIAINKTNV
ncbi:MULTISPECIES: CYTH domain-containing protein [unclassified Gilliamella]|uniref:CYTH domain-containing protein n=1 Tax=unclassified Gilliamella TaxID=2685620 RepID=UPI0013227C06|nr:MULTISPECIES: CYTH domain-containing protein [unclassified Gilliamella]MWN31199.1 CYTH domain-containing protein [Gilliamella sp. Pra-s60]MWP29748.1 CYTH domain-containing protein [Gilliamella sp. Pra-s54]